MYRYLQADSLTRTVEYSLSTRCRSTHKAPENAGNNLVSCRVPNNVNRLKMEKYFSKFPVFSSYRKKGKKNYEESSI